MIIAIDFDGTIVENKFPSIGNLLPEAKESINFLYNCGHKIIIWTSRGGDQLLDAVNFLTENDIHFHRINDNLPENTKQYGSNSRKIYAHRYIDDHNIGGFPGWKACIDDIEKSEEEYLKGQTPGQANSDSLKYISETEMEITDTTPLMPPFIIKPLITNTDYDLCTHCKKVLVKKPKTTCSRCDIEQMKKYHNPKSNY